MHLCRIPLPPSSAVSAAVSSVPPWAVDTRFTRGIYQRAYLTIVRSLSPFLSVDGAGEPSRIVYL